VTDAHPFDRPDTGADTPSERDVFAALPVAVLSVDAAGVIRDCYAGAEELFQLGASVMAGRSVSRLPSLGGELSDLLGQLQGQNASLHRGDVRLVPPLGDVDCVDISVNLLPDTDLRILTLHPKRLNALLMGGNSGDAAGQTLQGLAAMLAHELKNPLAGIKGAAQLARRVLPEAKQHLGALIEREVDRIGTLVDRFDTAERVDVGALSAVNVHAVIDHVIALMETGSGVTPTVHKVFDPSLPPASGDDDALIQILLNVFQNAQSVMQSVSPPGQQRHMAGEGSAHIRIETRFRRGFWVQSPMGERRKLPIEISISDNGPGIAAHILDRLFDPFVSAREGGTGLGLTIAARLVHAMNGRIRAENLPGGGACFTIHLPTHKESIAS